MPNLDAAGLRVERYCGFRPGPRKGRSLRFRLLPHDALSCLDDRLLPGDAASRTADGLYQVRNRYYCCPTAIASSRGAIADTMPR